MARRRAQTVFPTGTLVMPRHFLDPAGLSAPEFRVMCRERREWMRQHGVDPGDWQEVYALLRASRDAYGLKGAMERARDRIQPRTQVDSRNGELT